MAAALADLRHRQGLLLGKLGVLGFDLRAEASLTMLTADVVKSSAIEGESLDPQEVRSSIARRLGLDVAGFPKTSRDVEGIVEMMLDATRNFESPLTKDRLFGWHSALFPTGRSGMSRIAHFWFVTIHPLEDGNGRIARAIADMSLARADRTADRFYSMSSQIEAERKRYYQSLEAAQRGDINNTLVGVVSRVPRTCDRRG